MQLSIPPAVGDAWTNTPARLRGAVLTVAGVLILLVAVPALWPHAAPRGQILNGAEFGAVNGLLALGLVLTYRASRVINFSYGAMGALAATVAVELNLAHHVNWFVCIGIALLVGAALGMVVDGIIRWRFFTAPRLIVMVVTIGLAQLFGGIQLLVPGWLGGPSIVGGVTTPLTAHHVLIFPVLFNGNDLLIAIVVPVVLVAMGWFLLRTDAGIAVRSVADNSDRARLLGIPVRRLSTLVWVIAGLLAGLTSILDRAVRRHHHCRGGRRPRSSCPRSPPRSSPAWRACPSPSARGSPSGSRAACSSSTCPATAAPWATW